jgi:hypothetical protein
MINHAIPTGLAREGGNLLKYNNLWSETVLASALRRRFSPKDPTENRRVRGGYNNYEET